MTETCDYCTERFASTDLVDCNGCTICISCARGDGCEECSICGTWDELDGGMCSVCGGDYYDE